MLKLLHIRIFNLCFTLVVALSAGAVQPDITNRILQGGTVAIEAPQELAKRNNADLRKQSSASAKDKDKDKEDAKNKINAKDKDKDKKKVESKNDEKEEKLNELDEDEKEDKGLDKDKEKKEDKKKDEPTIKKPRRSNISQQTIQSRSVGYRIQAYTDNNFKTAKAAAQQRARDIAMKFPQYRSYITYKAPSWRLRIGDFKSQREAQAALSRIKSVFPKFARQMVIVRDHINVWSND